MPPGLIPASNRCGTIPPKLPLEKCALKQELMLSWIILVTLVIPSAMLGQPSDSIPVGETRLRLGMSRQAVLTALSSYEVRKADYSSGTMKYRLCEGENVFCSVFRMGHTGENEIASLEFTDDRLTLVTKLLNQGEELQGVLLARALYSAFATLLNDGKRTCVIDATQNEGPKGYYRAAFVICGGRTIVIQVNQSDSGPSVFLEERLESLLPPVKK